MFPPDYWTVNTRLQYRRITGRVNRVAMRQYFLYWYRQRAGCEPSRAAPSSTREPLGVSEITCPHSDVAILDDAIDYVLLKGIALGEQVPWIPLSGLERVVLWNRSQP